MTCLTHSIADCYKLLFSETKENEASRRHNKYKDKSHSTELQNQSGIVGVHHSHTAVHSAVRKAVKRWLFVDTN